MANCDRKYFPYRYVEQYIRSEYYDLLNPLPPVIRFPKMLRLMLAALSPHIRAEDEFLGWFGFSKPQGEQKSFSSSEIPLELEMLRQKEETFGSRTKVDRGHTLVDYEKILKNGLIWYDERINAELKLTPDDDYLLAMQDTVKAVKEFLSHLIDYVNDEIKSCTAELRKNKLLQIKDSLITSVFYPARNFRDAIQSIWLIHFLIPLAESSTSSISLGRFDQYVYPYYLSSVKNGMSRAEAKRILHQFYLLLNSHADGACLLNVGGEYNELSELIIECQKDFSLPAPILGARVTKNTPERIWNMLIDEKLFSRGQPTFYGEEACINALIEKGIAPEKAKLFSNSSCMGISLAGEEFNSMWGCVFSVSAALEAALNQGMLVTRQCDTTVPDIQPVTGLSELYAEFKKCAEYLFSISLQSYLMKADFCEKSLPDCFISLLTEICIEKRCDRVSGANYHNITVECMGAINVSDGICAIDNLVFKDRKYTLKQINDAVRANFEGFDNVRHDILSCPKFGQDSTADEYAVRITNILQEIIRSHSDGNRFCSPSLHTLDANVIYGKEWGAGYDGRLEGEPFAKNSGASNFARKADPTSLVLSAAKLPQHKFYGGQPLDVSFDLNLVKNQKKAIAALIKTYLQNGGLQFQVNALSSAVLRSAIEAPEQYSSLIIRVGGYSLYFNQLSQETKKEFVERFEREGN